MEVFAALILLSLLVCIIVLFLMRQIFMTIIPLVYKGGPYVPSRSSVIQRSLDLIDIKPGEILIDLGSGDGAVLLAAAKRGAVAIGYETNPWLVWQTRWRAKQAGLAHLVMVHSKDLWHADVHEADTIFVYILPKWMERLEAKLRQELKSGAQVVSNAFVFPAWEPTKIADTIHIYKKEGGR